VSEKKASTLYTYQLQLCQISANFDSFWHSDIWST